MTATEDDLRRFIKACEKLLAQPVVKEDGIYGKWFYVKRARPESLLPQERYYHLPGCLAPGNGLHVSDNGPYSPSTFIVISEIPVNGVRSNNYIHGTCS